MMQIEDLIQLAQTPGPLQGMAQAALQQLSEQATDDRTQRIGAHSSPAAGPDGLNFGDATPTHSSYPQQLMDALVNKYGMQAAAPSGEDENPHAAPDQRAIDAWQSAMEPYQPSLMDKIKSIGSAIIDDPSIAIDPAADMAGYMTPVVGNMRGSQDFSADAGDLSDALHVSGDHSDPLGALLKYLPSLGMDTLQMLSPVGLGKPRIGMR